MDTVQYVYVYVYIYSNMDAKIYDIPTHCKAGVVVNEGPDFQVKVEMVPVPEPGVSLPPRRHKKLTGRPR
jgi:hypothetical protein